MVSAPVAQTNTQSALVDLNPDAVQCVETHLASDDLEDIQQAKLTGNATTEAQCSRVIGGEAVGAPLPVSVVGLHQAVSGCEHPPSKMKR
eukprot:3176861-Amphidinium_carterae.1